MNVIQSILTKNNCYITGKTITVKGLMLHSVGCNQPSAAVFVKNWNTATPGGRDVCVHAFLEAGGDVYQTLPWNRRGWHCGSGINGSGNNTHIGVEMCEPPTITYTGGASWTDKDPAKTKTYVLGTYTTAAELFAFLCKEFNLDPLAVGVIISHSEGCKRGIASNHGDVEHIWSKFGLTMAQFRKDVKAAMGGAVKPNPTAPFVSDNAATIWRFLKCKGLSDYAVAGIMGNLYAESGLKPTNLQNSYESKLGFTDDTYTKAVDDGSYANFVKDCAGYGLAQWTYWSRKQALLDFVKASCVSVGDLTAQLEFMWKELQGYASVLSELKSATSVTAASKAFLVDYEKPADQSEAAQARRAAFGQGYYDSFAGQATTPTPETSATTSPTTHGTLYRVQVGAYSAKANAEAMLAKVKAAGFTDAFIKAE